MFSWFIRRNNSNETDKLLIDNVIDPAVISRDNMAINLKKDTLSGNSNFFDSLPDAIFNQIISLSEMKSLGRLAQSCKKLDHAIKETLVKTIDGKITKTTYGQIFSKMSEKRKKLELEILKIEPNELSKALAESDISKSIICAGVTSQLGIVGVGVWVGYSIGGGVGAGLGAVIGIIAGIGCSLICGFSISGGDSSIKMAVNSSVQKAKELREQLENLNDSISVPILNPEGETDSIFIPIPGE